MGGIWYVHIVFLSHERLSQYLFAMDDRSGRVSTFGFTHAKHRPKIAGGGDNTPLLVIRALTQWLSVLEARGTVPGNTLGGMFGCLSNFEDSLSGLERILTTPLPL